MLRENRAAKDQALNWPPQTLDVTASRRQGIITKPKGGGMGWNLEGTLVFECAPNIWVRATRFIRFSRNHPKETERSVFEKTFDLFVVFHVLLNVAVTVSIVRRHTRGFDGCLSFDLRRSSVIRSPVHPFPEFFIGVP